MTSRIRDAITAIHSRGVYPSCSMIGRELGRRSEALSADECREAKLVMESLGITPQKRGNPFPGRRPSFGSIGKMYHFWKTDR